MAKLQKRSTKKSSKLSTKDIDSKLPKITVRKRKFWDYEMVKSQYIMPVLVAALKKEKDTGYYRTTMYGQELVWAGAKFKSASPEGLKNRKNLVLFSMVAKNARKYISTHKLSKSRTLPAEYINENPPIGQKATGTDINYAYWHIAFNLGIIAESTFNKGLTIENKALRLASLASLGSDKTYQVIKDGATINEYVTLKGDDRLKEVYKKIRYTCYRYMQDMMKMLGDDFISYHTDCIYYKNTAANVQMVKKYITSKGLTFKMVKMRKNPSKK